MRISETEFHNRCSLVERKKAMLIAVAESTSDSWSVESS